MTNWCAEIGDVKKCLDDHGVDSQEFRRRIQDLARAITCTEAYQEFICTDNLYLLKENQNQTIIAALLSELAQPQYPPLDLTPTMPEHKSSLVGGYKVMPDVYDSGRDEVSKNYLALCHAYQLKRSSHSMFGVGGSFIAMSLVTAGYMGLMLPLMLLTPLQCGILVLASVALNQLCFWGIVQSNTNQRQCAVEVSDKLPAKEAMLLDRMYLQHSHGQSYDYAYKVGDRFFAGQAEFSDKEIESAGLIELSTSNSLVTKTGYSTAVHRMFYNYAAASWQDASLLGVIAAISLKLLLVTSFVMFMPMSLYLSTGITILLVAKLALSFAAPLLGCALAYSELNKEVKVTDDKVMQGTKKISESYAEKHSVLGRVAGLFSWGGGSEEAEEKYNGAYARI